ncbi:hypothetical protein L873DRAFT_1663433 [Choiromyces venosus 120613-1]|uniref:MARVEL domain-containing protein n=1 Tax=Choiromyces venosus 120613-1 TaxID=1336337 RepID=A0A3N4K3U7_9PEZI|nr:hypothetical protein L873DRAFT_1663433 [Choiromyces venosus 120613-1]
MVQKSKSHRTSPPDRAFITLPRLALRILQLLLALTIAGIYGQDLHMASKHNVSAGPRWVFAEVVAGLSFLLAGIYLLPFVRSFRTFFLDGVLFLFWMILFGIFGGLFIGRDCSAKSSAGNCERMKAGAWVDMVGMLAWFFSFVGGGVMWWKDRHGSIYTGRGSVA